MKKNAEKSYCDLCSYCGWKTWHAKTQRAQRKIPFGQRASGWRPDWISPGQSEERTKPWVKDAASSPGHGKTPGNGNRIMAGTDNPWFFNSTVSYVPIVVVNEIAASRRNLVAHKGAKTTKGNRFAAS